jgi:hypothetical protein
MDAQNDTVVSPTDTWVDPLGEESVGMTSDMKEEIMMEAARESERARIEKIVKREG